MEVTALREITATVRDRAFEMFAKGMSTNAVAGALKTTWYIASQLKSAWLTEHAGERTVRPVRPDAITAAAVEARLSEPHPPRENAPITGLDLDPTHQLDAEPASTAPDDSVPESWDIAITVPSDRAVDIFATFTTQEKFDALGFVLQRRMDDALNASEVPHGDE